MPGQLTTAAIAILACASLTACTDRDGPAENLGERIDDAVSDARDRLGDASEEARDRFEEVRDEAREAGEEIGDALRDN